MWVNFFVTSSEENFPNYDAKSRSSKDIIGIFMKTSLHIYFDEFDYIKI